MSERPSPAWEESGGKQKTDEAQCDKYITKLTADDYKVPVEEGREGGERRILHYVILSNSEESHRNIY